MASSATNEDHVTMPADGKPSKPVLPVLNAEQRAVHMQAAKERYGKILAEQPERVARVRAMFAPSVLRRWLVS